MIMPPIYVECYLCDNASWSVIKAEPDPAYISLHPLHHKSYYPTVTYCLLIKSYVVHAGNLKKKLLNLKKLYLRVSGLVGLKVLIAESEIYFVQEQ